MPADAVVYTVPISWHNPSYTSCRGTTLPDSSPVLMICYFDKLLFRGVSAESFGSQLIGFVNLAINNQGEKVSDELGDAFVSVKTLAAMLIPRNADNSERDPHNSQHRH